jgi:hypothetical protein
MDTLTPPTSDWRAPAQSDLNHKQLKALAKASRPWYAKKRTWFLGFVGLVIIVAAGSSASSGGGTSTKTNGGVSSLSGNGKNPPQADVTLDKCGAAQYIDYPQATVRITNHSSERSNYMVSVNFLDASGTVIGSGTALASNVEPGQSAVDTAGGIGAHGAPAQCKVVNVDRFASN